MHSIGNRKTLGTWRRQLAIAVLMGASFLVSASPALSLPSSAPGPQSETQPENPVKPLNGLEALKAQMNAMQGGLDNLKRLREFFDSANFNETAILERAQRLITTLPQEETADDAAWRIAAVASLTLSSGVIADLDIDDGYALDDGALGWDLGPEGSATHAGFTPVTPNMLDSTGTARPVSGTTALSDGIASVADFEASLPNGLYRVVIIRDGAQDADIEENPFGGEIRVNGTPLIGQTGGDRDQLVLSSSNAQVASASAPAPAEAARGLAIEGWAIVQDGRLNIGFEDLPAGRAITAIIAEPFDLEQLELAPSVMETLAESLGDIGTAAGPETKLKPQGPRFGRVFGRSLPSRTGQPAAAQNGAPKSSTASKSSRKGSSGGAESFGSTRARLAAASTAADTGTATSEEPAAETDNEASAAPATTDTDTVPFEKREILVKRSAGDEADTAGVAIDLEALLDEAAESGVFTCAAVPCEDIADFSIEPDLSGASELLDDWLSNPAGAIDSWFDLDDVLAGRAGGSEVAIVYEFDIDAESWTDVELRASAGSGLFVWLDGEFIFGASEGGDFSDTLDFEYILDLPDLPGGRHYLQVVSESHIDNPDFALELRGTPVTTTTRVTSTTSVSEPGTLALFGTALLAFAGFRRLRSGV